MCCTNLAGAPVAGCFPGCLSVWGTGVSGRQTSAKSAPRVGRPRLAAPAGCPHCPEMGRYWDNVEELMAAVVYWQNVLSHLHQNSHLQRWWWKCPSSKWVATNPNMKTTNFRSDLNIWRQRSSFNSNIQTHHTCKPDMGSTCIWCSWGCCEGAAATCICPAGAATVGDCATVAAPPTVCSMNCPLAVWNIWAIWNGSCMLK